MPMDRRLARSAALSLAALSLAMPHYVDAKALPTPSITAIAVTPDGASLAKTRNRRYVATATFQSGSPRVLSAVPIAAGGRHTCALLTDGTVDCWGRNELGQLGNGTAIDSPTPRAVGGLANAIAIAAGESHTCALRAEGTVACWGDNFRGQLGDGTNGRSSTPVAVQGIASATAIAAGREHTCALLADRTVRCWGRDLHGQLGDGANLDSNTPVAVRDLSAATALAAGGEHTCALLSKGTLRCWGGNFFGQLGDATNDDSNTPVAVTGLADVLAVSAGTDHGCAVLASGEARCWGRNDSGRLGNGLPGDSNVPVAVSGVSTALAVAAGDQHTCVTLADATVRCWGSNASGQLGNGSLAGGVFSTPTDVVGLGGTAALAAGNEHVCTLSSAGIVRCWGSNADGQLGTGSDAGPEVCGVAGACSTKPAVAGRIGVAMVSHGGLHACALFTDGTIACWGSNSSGELGDGTTNESHEPVAVSGVTTATAVSVGGAHTCALLADGRVSCWGLNLAGQLGDGSTASSAVPVTVSGIATATAVSAGQFFTCAVLSNGTARCWGFNRTGEIGSGSATGPDTCSAEGVDFSCSTSPVPVSGLSAVRAISAGGNHACALLAGGSLACWGQNARGQLGNANQDECNGSLACSASPLPVGGITTATTVAAGGQHTCATLDDGTARCWGSNDASQLGNPATDSPLPTPLVVTGIADATSITAGFQNSCARLAGGGLSCWGSNALGQLGNGTTGANSATPVAVSSISSAVEVSTGTHASCALETDGTVRCWGFNSAGQLGDGTTATASAPVPVSHIFDAIAAVVWSSLAPSVAVIEAGGVTVGVAEGLTTIAATAANFAVSGDTPLTVPEPGAAFGSAAALTALARLAARKRRPMSGRRAS